MIKNAVFCDFCKEHIEDQGDGTVFCFIDAEHSRLSLRDFDKTTSNDVCICNECITELKRFTVFCNKDKP